MAKLTLNRLIETSKFLATTSGQELTDFITYMADLAEQTLRALRNGLTFADNFNCKVQTLRMTHGISAKVNADGKVPIGVIAQNGQALSWYTDNDGNLNVTSYLPGYAAAGSINQGTITALKDHKLSTGDMVEIPTGIYMASVTSGTTFTVGDTTFPTGTITWRKVPSANVSLIILFQ